MDRTLIQKLIDERNQIWHRAKEIMDAAEKEGRDLTAEEDAQIANTNADLDARDARIKQLQSLDARAELANAARTVLDRGHLSSDARAILAVARGEQKFVDFRALATSTDTDAQSFYGLVQSYQQTLNPTYQLATVIRTTNGENITIPRKTAGVTVYTPGEGTAITASDPTLSSITLGAFGYKSLTVWSADLDEDNAINLQSLLAEDAGEQIGVAAGADFTTGAGTSGPKGFIAAGTNGGTAAGSPFFAADDLITLYYAVAQPYRMAPGAAWQMSNSAIQKARKFKTSTTNEYLWQPGLTMGTPDTLMGRPVYENPAMATVASASKSVAFGNFKKFFVREAGGLRVAASTDYKFAEDQLALKCVWRVDSDLPDALAIKYLVSANA